jgi:hypothetical protein
MFSIFKDDIICWITVSRIHDSRLAVKYFLRRSGSFYFLIFFFRKTVLQFIDLYVVEQYYACLQSFRVNDQSANILRHFLIN